MKRRLALSLPLLFRYARPQVQRVPLFFLTVPRRSISVSAAQIAQLASRPQRQLTLADLAKHGIPPLSTPALLASANFASSLIPIRLAHRIQALRNLPFIVVSNPHISRIYNNYMHSLETLLPFLDHRIASMTEERQFTDALADLVQTHANTIPVLARGFLECRSYIGPEAVTAFLEEHLRARIGTRLIAEQHIALHLASLPQHGSSSQSSSSSYIGVIDTALRPASVLSHCETFVSDLCEFKYGVRPTLTIDGAPNTTIAHIPTHLEYILTELLKNAFRATVESGNERHPIEATIALSPANSFPPSYGTIARRKEAVRAKSQLSDSGTSMSTHSQDASLDRTRDADLDLDLDSDIDTEILTIRIRDRGGGIAPEHLPHIWGYSFTTFSEEDAAARAGVTTSSQSSSPSTSPSSTSFNNGSTQTKSDAAAATTTTAASHDNVSGTGNAFSQVDALAAIAASGGGQGGGSIAGLGYGLPLSRAYAGYFGGAIRVQSLWGWGTDVYLTLKGLKGF